MGNHAPRRFHQLYTGMHMPEGRLINFNSDRGFGFLSCEGVERGRVFVHVNEFEKIGQFFPRSHHQYGFDIEQRQDGKWRAINLRVIDDTAR
jgi:cold shock CspA family protein